MIVNSIRRDILRKQTPGITDAEIVEIQAFGIFLRRAGKTPPPDQRIAVDKLAFAYATNVISSREYLDAMSMRRLFDLTSTGTPHDATDVES